MDIQFSNGNIVAANTITGFYSGRTLLNSSNIYFSQNNLIQNHIQVQDLFCNETYQKINEQTKQMLARNFTFTLYPLMDYSVNVW
ncbi:MAG: hypothetical protein ACFCUE_07940 [Candidatus Bathyarchaeia archaeon]